MRPVTQSFTLQAASTTNLRAAASIAGAGALTLLITATTDSLAHKVVITSAGDDSGVTFTISGKDADGKSITEDLTGANAGAATSTKHYKSDLTISADGASAGDVSIGFAAPAQGPTVIGEYRSEVSTVTAMVSGTINYTIQYSNDYEDVFSKTAVATFLNHDDTDVVGATASKTGAATVPVLAYRLTIASYTSTPTIDVVYLWSDC